MQEPNSTGDTFRNVGDTAQGSDSKSPACAGKRHQGWVMNGYWYVLVMEDLEKRPYKESVDLSLTVRDARTVDC